MKILFVDDEENIRELFQEYFKKDYEITLAENGQEALDISLSQTFDLIISDISLPKINGIQFIKKLRFEGKATPFIVITGDSDIQLAIDLFRLGAVDFFLKPFRMEALRLRIQKYESADTDTYCLFQNHEIVYDQLHLKMTFLARIKNINKYVGLILNQISPNPKIKEDDLLNIKIVLYELLSNAIEHGCAGISYKEKQSILQANQDYFGLVDNKCKENDSHIHVVLKYDADELILSIADEGDGFNPADIPSPIENPDANLVNGRGIFLVRMNVDNLYYNEKGNEVTFHKKIC
ncbi:response regulator receiver domain protein [Leptospira ryugenii]|uniref:Response regulator receiver domain protein n=1 Tax=Leptospira ryugenii TaxID=1917863 RepID=A0A2P2E3W0_9LEPT|nr:ATP-binding protein [Leptospira ryugenii]GBF51575.1 response regulator receiver domain protein [Leptospira ryugenii]